MPDLSVLLPIDNGARLLRSAVNSESEAHLLGRQGRERADRILSRTQPS